MTSKQLLIRFFLSVGTIFGLAAVFVLSGIEPTPTMRMLLGVITGVLVVAVNHFMNDMELW
jgi:hypothetical protein